MNEKHPKNASILGDPATMNYELMVAFCTVVQKASEVPRSSFLIPH